jgi:multidrug efflux pump
MAILFVRLPSSFLPDEDQGVFLTMAQLPAGATQERTQKVLDEVTKYYLENEKDNVNSVFTVNGFGFSGRGQNTGLAFVSLKGWDERPGEKNKVRRLQVVQVRTSRKLKMRWSSPLTCQRSLNWVRRPALTSS